MSVKLESYRVFKEVAEVGNITAAAQALYISQSAVSQSIKQLENDLQTRLFSRNSRGVTLTAEGKMLYEYVRSAMGLLETGEAKLSQTRELQMGQLVIGASDTVTSQFLLPYLDSFHKEHPAIHIQIVSGRSHKVLGLLQSGKVEIAFASNPQDASSLSTFRCFDTHSIFVAAADYDCNFDHIYTLEEIIRYVHSYMNLHLNRQEMRAILTGNVKFTRNRLLQIIPLFLKKPVMAFSYQMLGVRPYTATYTNPGPFRVPAAMEPYIDHMEVVLGQATRPSPHCASISFGDTLEVTFAGTGVSSETERRFFTHLVQAGIPVKVISNRKS